MNSKVFLHCTVFLLIKYQVGSKIIICIWDLLGADENMKIYRLKVQLRIFFPIQISILIICSSLLVYFSFLVCRYFWTQWFIVKYLAILNMIRILSFLYAKTSKYWRIYLVLVGQNMYSVEDIIQSNENWDFSFSS